MGTELMDMDDYCLENIFKHMCMRDQIMWACTCQRMSGIFQYVNRNHFKHLTIFGSEPIVENLPNIYVVKAAGRLVKQLTTFENNILAVMNYLNYTPFIEALEFCGDELHKDDIMLLTKLPMLESVTLWNCRSMEGKYLTSIPKLKVLNINNCAFASENDFIAMCKAVPNLKELNLSDCKNIATKGLRALANHCNDLEKLTLITDQDDIQYNFLASLNSLNTLHIKNQNQMEMLRLVTNLADCKSEQIKSLNLETAITPELADQIVCLQGLTELRLRTPFGDLDDEILAAFCELENLTELYVPHESNITSDGILALVRHSRKLKLLDISHSEAVNRHYFVTEAFEVLKKRDDLRDEPFMFISLIPKQTYNRDQIFPPNQNYVRYVHNK